MQYQRNTVPSCGTESDKPRITRSWLSIRKPVCPTHFLPLQIRQLTPITHSDCGWQGKTRNATGGFTWDTSTIPSGIPALASFVHGLGLKFGVYSDGCVSKWLSGDVRVLVGLMCRSNSGVFACDFVGGTAHYLGSLGHETSDAATFASWGADYLKVHTSVPFLAFSVVANLY